MKIKKELKQLPNRTTTRSAAQPMLKATEQVL
jgi:hypothetical protein